MRHMHEWEKNAISIYNMTALRGCRLCYQSIDRIIDATAFDSPSFGYISRSMATGWRYRREREWVDEGEQSWYAEPETAAALISVTRRVRCTLRLADRIIDRWMVGVGKGKRACPASVSPPPLVPGSPFSLFLPSRIPSPPLSLFSSDPVSLTLSVSRRGSCLLPLSRFRYLLLRAPRFSLFN